MTYNNLGLKGTFTALVTPRSKNGSPNADFYQKLVERQLEAGIDGLVLFGTTGEAEFVNREFQYARIHKTVENANGITDRSIPIIAGISDNDEEKVIDYARRARDAGADAGLLTPLCYVKPTQEAIASRYVDIANAVPDFKFVVYNVPGRTGVNIEPTTLRYIIQAPNIIAIKEAAGPSQFVQLGQYIEIAAEFSKEQKRPFTVLSGDDASAALACLIGAHGVISVDSNIAPQRRKEVIDAARGKHPVDSKLSIDRDRDIAYALELHNALLPLANATMANGNPQSVIYIMQQWRKEMGINFEIGNPHTQLGAAPEKSRTIEFLMSEMTRQRAKLR